MKKIEIEMQEKRHKRFTFLTALIVGATVLLAFLQVVFSNQLAGYSQDMAALLQEEKALSLENALLNKQIASSSSIMAISKRAQEKNFVVPTKFLVVAEQESVALLHNGL